MAARLNTEEFIIRAKKLHGDRYDYSNVDYINNYTPITIICKKHGSFEQKPSVHFRGSGCPSCSVEKQTLSEKDFIRKAQEVHGDAYDYSQVNYKNAKNSVTIICEKHGAFKQLADNHLRGMGCLQCGREKTADKKTLTTKEFVEKAKIVHGNKYDYSLSKYKKGKTPLTIICKKHGPFKQAGKGHLSGKGCPECAKEIRADKKRSNTEEFIRKAKKIHGGKYDYSQVTYLLANKAINIKCKKHGVFEQKASSHLRGAGCPKCAIEEIKKSQRWTTKKFITEARKIHGSFYDYSNVRYKNAKNRVVIMCKTHGPFKQSPYSHLKGSGCPRCYHVKVSERQSTPFAAFLSKAKKIHGNRYNYDKSRQTYSNLSKKVTITCPYHGEFKQLAEQHLMGRGCQACSESWSEKKIAEWLANNGIIFQRQKKFKGLYGKGKRRLSFDFFIPAIKHLIEFDGIQHFKQVKAFGGVAKLKETQYYDGLKTKWARANGYSLCRIPYDQAERIEEILENLFDPDWLRKRRESVSKEQPATNKLLIDERVKALYDTVKKKNGKIVGGVYTGEKSKIKVRCEHGHTWDAVPQHLKRGVWCPFCAGNRKLGLDKMQEIAKEKNGICLSKIYVNAHQKLKWQCSKGHIWEAAPMYIRRGRWCPICKKG